MSTTALTYDMRDVLKVLEALRGVEADLRRQTNTELRAAAGRCATGLVGELRSAGAASATPQGRLVAQTVRIKSDRLPAVQLGGRARVGSRGTSAGVLVWGSERGGRNFPPGPGGPYWIDPTVRRFEQGRAPDEYRRAVTSILSRRGVL